MNKRKTGAYKAPVFRLERKREREKWKLSFDVFIIIYTQKEVNRPLGQFTESSQPVQKPFKKYLDYFRCLAYS